MLSPAQDEALTELSMLLAMAAIAGILVGIFELVERWRKR
jgi:hypothetical protein